MKKFLSVLLIFAFCFSLIAAPAFAQITFESETTAEEAAPEESDFEEAPVTEAQLDQARLTLKTIADYVSDFDADEAYASLSKIVDLADNFDFWKDDMTSDARNFVFGELKKNIVDDGKEDFFEELIRLSASDEKAKAEFAKSNITIVSDNSLDIMGIMTMTVEGNSYVYADATGKVMQRVSLSKGPEADTMLITYEAPGEDGKMMENNFLVRFGDNTLTIAAKFEEEREFSDALEIAFTETNKISITGLEDKRTRTLEFVPEKYQIILTTPETPTLADKDAPSTSTDTLELNPENKSFVLTADGVEVFAAYFYPETKEITIAAEDLSEMTSGFGAEPSSDSITLKFEDETKTVRLTSGDTEIVNLIFNAAKSMIEIEISAGEMGMMSMFSLKVNKADSSVAFTMMGIEIFNATLDPQAETITIHSLDFETQIRTEEVMTLEDIARMLNPAVIDYKSTDY